MYSTVIKSGTHTISWRFGTRSASFICNSLFNMNNLVFRLRFSHPEVLGLDVNMNSSAI